MRTCGRGGRSGGLTPLKKKSLAYPLLADISKDISRDYGVLVTDPADGMYGAALRGLFIIDTEGTIRSVTVSDYDYDDYYYYRCGQWTDATDRSIH